MSTGADLRPATGTIRKPRFNRRIHSAFLLSSPPAAAVAGDVPIAGANHSCADIVPGGRAPGCAFPVSSQARRILSSRAPSLRDLTPPANWVSPGHLPNSLRSAYLAWRAVSRGGWVIGANYRGMLLSERLIPLRQPPARPRRARRSANRRIGRKYGHVPGYEDRRWGFPRP